MYLVKTPIFIQKLFPNFIWKIPTTEKKIFLSFDDGPIPEVTPKVMDLLDKFNAKASFFCVGQNAEKYPTLVERLNNEGHFVGNHTYNHLNGWAADNVAYFQNVRRCASVIKSDVFRPPYGRLKPRQAQFLQKHYSIVMWDVLSGDFDPNISVEQCFQNVIQNAVAGSIVVFHDSLKSQAVLQTVLPRVLNHYTNLGFTFDSLPLGWLHSNKRKQSA